jgi:ribosomal protein S27AE
VPAQHPHDDSPGFRFCPRCGGDLGVRQLKPGDPTRLVCGRCDFVFYLDPKVAVGTIV